jgi:5S rRNA maturation endonuclease (ribonuclease M5)
MQMNDANHFVIADIKERVKIWDVCNEFSRPTAPVCKAIKSPFRDEKSASFSIFADGDMAKDHATGESYDIILLFQEFTGCNTHDAIIGCGAIAGMSGGELPSELSVPPPPRSTFQRDTSEHEASKPSLRDRLGEFTPEVMKGMQELAAANLKQGEGILSEFCDRKKISNDFMMKMVEQGLVGVLDHQALRSPAIGWMFDNPHFGTACKLRLTAESSRITIWWKGKAQEHLFGEQLPSKGKAILTEGESDALVLLQLGLPALGVIGAGVTPDHRVLHYSLSYKDVAVWYDADDAGRKAQAKVKAHIQEHASGVKIFAGIGDKVPNGMDIGECWEKWGERFKKYATGELDRMESQDKDTREDQLL